MDASPNVFRNHPRRWRENRYVYPVIARRSRGLSIGVNLNPDGVCPFRCVYCAVDRAGPHPEASVELPVLEAELRAMLAGWPALFSQPDFAAVPPGLRRLNDVAFSGDGEPTASPVFEDAVRLVTRLHEALRLGEVRIVVITNACCLDAPAVQAGLRLLDEHRDEVWAKLDAGTEGYFRRVNRAGVPLQRILDNIALTAEQRPVVIQSMFLRLHGEPPPAAEIDAYLQRLARLLDRRARIDRVQIYTVARQTAETFAGPLTQAELERIASRVEELGLRTEVFA